MLCPKRTTQKMYEKFYNFSEKPFNVTPDTKFFFSSPKHLEALNSLIYAVDERKGFVVITGEIGAGKTTVSRNLLGKLNSNTRVALITNTNINSRELLLEILEEFEVEFNPKATKHKLAAALNNYLIKQLTAGVNVVLIIDEAQNLTTKVLEEVRMLSNLETEKEKLIQIILMGQPELRQKLNNPKLEQFRQRIAVYYHLNSLNYEETKEYILHRLSLVNSNGYKEIFSPEAIDLIYTHSRGTPRLINLFCDSALLSGFVYENKLITAKIISEIVKEREIGSASANAEILNVTELKKSYCCLKCLNFYQCGLKWDRGVTNQKQLCCNSCQDYLNCSRH